MTERKGARARKVVTSRVQAPSGSMEYRDLFLCILRQARRQIEEEPE